MNFLIRHRAANAKNQLAGLLVQLGFSKAEVYARPGKTQGYHAARKHQHLHDRKPLELDAIGQKAKRIYKERMKQIHPDRGGEHEHAVNLNGIWSKTKRVLALHGVVVVVLLLATTALAGKWTLTWAPNPEPDIVQYQVFDSGLPLALTPTNGLVIANVANGLHNYTVTAINAVGVSSDPSTNYTVAFPSPPGGIRIGK